ncbi:hypothetical protein ACWGAN_22280 [Streptomyces sp. NPDC054945]
MEDFPAPHPRSGRSGAGTTVVQGFDRTVEAVLGMARGDDPGGMTVRTGA